MLCGYFVIKGMKLALQDARLIAKAYKPSLKAVLAALLSGAEELAQVIAPGERMIGFVGPLGGGKSTFYSLCFNDPDAASLLCGDDVATRFPIYCPQDGRELRFKKRISRDHSIIRVVMHDNLSAASYRRAGMAAQAASHVTDNVCHYACCIVSPRGDRLAADKVRHPRVMVALLVYPCARTESGRVRHHFVHHHKLQTIHKKDK